MNHLGTSTLTTERLILRRFTAEDASAMFENWANDPEVTRYMRWKPHESIETTQALLADWVDYYEDPEYYHWSITLREGGELVGSIALLELREQDESAEVGYCVGRAYWGNGYVTEALRAVLRHGLREVGLNRIEACHAQKNPASGRVMQKAGMTHEGTARQKYRANEGFQDCELYGILREDLT